MSDQRHDHGSNDWFTMDRAYFRDQAREAMRIFVAPLTGSYRAITPHAVNGDPADSRPER